ncbi:hypothetical protein FHS21_003123 [Phyllobacterium trifolii]|uniref:Uncharacterized protein n=1 Tax=Phyllobacterium trifolii TaxID=300193 RepID=A0A839U882_9HYPH|nr:hypothetical protein [Phyllobacterium trifolii]
MAGHGTDAAARTFVNLDIPPSLLTYYQEAAERQ